MPVKLLQRPAVAYLFLVRSHDRAMNFLTVILIGVVLGALDGAGIFFEPKEPYKWQILGAATLKGAMVALLTAFSLSASLRKRCKVAGRTRGRA